MDSILPTIPVFAGRKAKALTKASDKILRIRKAAQIGYVRHIIAQIAQKMQATLEPDLV
jgi:hypothetical protein